MSTEHPIPAKGEESQSKRKGPRFGSLSFLRPFVLNGAEVTNTRQLAAYSDLCATPS